MTQETGAPFRIVRPTKDFWAVGQSLRITPAMEANLTDHIWTVEELIALLPKPTVGPSRIDPELFRRALGETA